MPRTKLHLYSSAFLISQKTQLLMLKERLLPLATSPEIAYLPQPVLNIKLPSSCTLGALESGFSEADMFKESNNISPNEKPISRIMTEAPVENLLYNPFCNDAQESEPIMSILWPVNLLRSVAVCSSQEYSAPMSIVCKLCYTG